MTDATPNRSASSLLDIAVDALSGTPRPTQKKMVEEISSAIESEKHIAIQAGTGTGKSWGYLIPALEYSTRSSQEEPVVISTATIALQRQIVERDLPKLTEVLSPHLPRSPRWALLKGRNNYLCLNKVNTPTPEVSPDEEELYSSQSVSILGEQIQRLRAWAEETDDGDRDNLEKGVDDQAWRQVSVTSRECIGASHCPFGEQCFAEKARAEAQSADVVITNHALLAIDSLSDNSVLPDHDLLIVDEAHELEPRMTATATLELSISALSILSKQGAKLLPRGETLKLDDAIEELNEELKNNKETLHGMWEQIPSSLSTIFDSLKLELSILRKKIDTAPPGEKTEDPEKATVRQQALTSSSELHDAVTRILDATGDSDTPNYDVVWLNAEDARSNTGIIHVAPLSVAGLIHSSLFEEKTVVLTSATLALGGKFHSMLYSWGLSPSECKTVDLGMPFDTRKHGILYIASHLPSPGREGPSEESISECIELITAAQGRTLGLFSSRRAAEIMAERVQDKVPYDILLQGEDSLANLIRDFRNNETSCLFGTLSLWQGVDIPGSSLSLVIIDRLPFPRPDDPLTQARQKAINDTGSSGFMAVSATHAALLMAQGSGRLLRSNTDKGVVAVLDPRLVTKRYGNFLIKSMPPFWQTVSGDTVRQALRRLRKGSP